MDLTSIKAKAKDKKAKDHVNIDAKVYEHADYVEIRIPRRIPNTAIRASSTEKATPMATVVPRWSDETKRGSVSATMTVTQAVVNPETGETTEQSADFGVRIGTFNLFL